MFSGEKMVKWGVGWCYNRFLRLPCRAENLFFVQLSYLWRGEFYGFEGR